MWEPNPDLYQYKHSVVVFNRDGNRCTVADESRKEWRQWCDNDWFSLGIDNDGFSQLVWLLHESAARLHYDYLVIKERSYSRSLAFTQGENNGIRDSRR